MSSNSPQGSFTDDELVTLSWLAETALAQPSTVSNWRRRDPSFPEPAGGTSARPLFKRNELLEWGRRTDRLDPSRVVADRTTAERASAVLNAFRGTVAPREYLDAAIAVFENLYGTAKHPYAGVYGALFDSPVVDELTAAARPIINGVEPSDLFEAILQQVAAKGLGREDHQTPVWLAGFMAVQVAASASSIIDPAAGIGTLLLTGLRSLGATSATAFDINSAALRILRLRAMLAGADVTVEMRDIVGDPPFPLPKAEVVLLDPPFGLRNLGKELRDDPRFAAFAHGSASGDGLWVQIALSHLRGGGTAVVHVIGSAAFSPRDRQFRDELVSSGAILAVIGLEGALAPRSTVRSNIWVLGTPTGTPSSTVRFVDAGRVRPEELVGLLGNALDLDLSIPAAEFDCADVSRLELLRAESVLNPTRWTATQYAEREALTDIRRAKIMLEDIEREARVLGDTRLNVAVPDFAEPPIRAISLRELRDRKMARRLRQVSDSRPAGELAHVESLPVITTRELREGFNSDAAGRVPNTAVGEELRYGDILYGEVGENSQIKVWTNSDAWVLGRGVGAYRLDTDELLPEYVAALLTSTQAGAFNTGTTISRRNVDLVPIPLIPIAQQREITETLRALRGAEERAATLAGQLATVQRTLIDVAAAGYLSIAHQGQS
ncbi:N-6 DNA methylase [Leifsonia sp. YAF41]|uniref:N-6 DNA methylase n=1 Tax=Leifsonia sp. YAF41 TaxID=3233086 RepID=UPI003F955112